MNIFNRDIWIMKGVIYKMHSVYCIVGFCVRGPAHDSESWFMAKSMHGTHVAQHVTWYLFRHSWLDTGWLGTYWVMNVDIQLWWCHEMEAFSTLLALCEGNPPVTGGFTLKKGMMWSLDVFFVVVVVPNKFLKKQHSCQWFEMWVALI